MNEWIEILKYSIPSLILLGGIFMMLNYFTKKELAKTKLELLIGNQKLITPIRLQAYERLNLFLERINPEALLQRLNGPNQKSGQIKIILIKTVRQEFSHNLSQQVYISSNAWQAVKNAKEQVIRTINITSSEVNPEANSYIFLKTFLENYNNMDTQPIETASEILKNEVRLYFSM